MMRIDPATWAAFCASPTEENFGPFYEQSRGLVWTLCWRILRDEDEAQDASQGVYARLLVHAHQAGAEAAKDSSAAISRIIYQATIREANRLRLRRHRRNQREVVMDALTPQPAGDPSVRDAAALAQAHAQIEALVAALPEKYRLPLELHYFHGMTQNEIAALIGRTQGIVSQRISRGLRLLEPIAERAGLGRAAALLGVVVAGAGLCPPPTAQAASVVFAHAQALIASGGFVAGGAGGLVTLKALAGAALTVKTVILATLALTVLVTATLFGPSLYARIGDLRTPAKARQGLEASKSGSPLANASGQRNALSETTSTQAGSKIMGVGPNAPKNSAKPGAVITGRVISQATGRPVAGVRVQAAIEDRYHAWATQEERDLKIETVSDGRGQYRLEGLPQGKRLVVVARPEAYAWQARLIQPASSAATRCDLALEPSAELTVTVTNPAGRPIEGASIGIDDQTSAYENLSIKTDKDGRVLARNLSPTRATSVMVNKDGYDTGSRSKNLIFPAGQLRTSMAFIIPPLSQESDVVTGRVTDDKGNPLPGITVQWGIDGGSDMSRTTTGSEGRYQVTGHDLNAFQSLFAYGKGWATQSRRNFKSANPAIPAVVDFKMQPGHWLAGVVVDDKGKPLAGISIRTEGVSPGNMTFPGVQANITPDAQGRFRIDGLPASGFRLQLWGKDYPDEYLENPALDREMRIVLKPAGKIRGRVIDQTSNQPIQSFTIRISGMSVAGDRAHSGQTFSSPEGHFELDGLKQDQPCEFTIEALGYPPHVEKNIPVTPLDSDKESTIELGAGRKRYGLLLDRDTGSPLAGAEVIYGLVDERFPFSWGYLREMNSSAKILQRQTTDAKGSFTFSVGEERGSILILPQKHQRLLIKPMDQGQYLIGETLVVKLGPAATLTGKALIGGPKAGAFVGLAQTGAQFSFGASESESTQTANDGAYRFEGLKPGEYRMTVQRGLDPPVYHTYTRSLKTGRRRTEDIQHR